MATHIAVVILHIEVDASVGIQQGVPIQDIANEFARQLLDRDGIRIYQVNEKEEHSPMVVLEAGVSLTEIGKDLPNYFAVNKDQEINN